MVEAGAHAEVFTGAQYVACALGTSPYTKRVDLDYSTAGAKLAAATGTVTHYALVTSSTSYRS